MEEKNYLKDISEIKDLMNRSSRFISLSGVSGVLAGIYALIGAYYAHSLISEWNYNGHLSNITSIADFKYLLLGIAFVVTVFSIITAFILTKRKVKNNGEKIWDASSKRLLINFLFPLVTGGIYTLLILQKGYYDLIAPTTLIFYGLALINASKFTIGNIKYLGVAEVILGLIAMNFVGYGLYFWALGFGVFHIVYGSIMYLKYDRK